jgi:hypothetical protein
VTPPNYSARFQAMADTVRLELWYDTNPQTIADICHVRHPDFLIGFLSRCGFNDVALELWQATHKETTP